MTPTPGSLGDRHARSPWWTAPLFAAGVTVPGMLAARWGASFGTDWEKRLTTPPVWPPNWAFPAVWAVLYPCMGVATWHVWRRRGEAAVVGPLALFGAHLLLNYTWLPVVHTAKDATTPAVMDVAVGVPAFAAGWAYGRVSPSAARWYAPYLAWTVFTTAIKIWRAALNARPMGSASSAER